MTNLVYRRWNFKWRMSVFFWRLWRSKPAHCQWIFTELILWHSCWAMNLFISNLSEKGQTIQGLCESYIWFTCQSEPQERGAQDDHAISCCTGCTPRINLHVGGCFIPLISCKLGIIHYCWVYGIIAGFMASLLGFWGSASVSDIVRFRTVPDWEPRHDAMETWWGRVAGFYCTKLWFRPLWVLGQCIADPQLDSEVVSLFLGQWTVSFSLVLGLCVGQSLMATRVNRILKSNMMWVVSRVGRCCSCLPCRQNMKFDLCAINDNQKVTDFAAAPTT